MELSSFQLHFTDSLALDCAAITNIADDHLDWHGGIEAYAADKSKVFRNVRRALVFNADDRRVSALASAAHTAEDAGASDSRSAFPSPARSAWTTAGSSTAVAWPAAHSAMRPAWRRSRSSPPV